MQLLLFFLCLASISALNISISYEASVAQAPSGFKPGVQTAVSWLQAKISTPVTVYIAVGYGDVNHTALGANQLGESMYELYLTDYRSIVETLQSTATSINDATSLGSLPIGDPLHGSHQYVVSSALAKALANVSSAALDGWTGFSSEQNTFDYDPSDGITAGLYDFVAVVKHELSEILGRETLNGQLVAGVASYTVGDLFRFSSAGLRSFDGTQAAYFSIDSGTTDLNNFNTDSTGDYGDWANGAADAANAFESPGVLEPFSDVDLIFMDVIGWSLLAPNITSPAVAVPVSDAGLNVTALAGGLLGALLGVLLVCWIVIHCNERKEKYSKVAATT